MSGLLRTATAGQRCPLTRHHTEPPTVNKGTTAEHPCKASIGICVLTTATEPPLQRRGAETGTSTPRRSDIRGIQSQIEARAADATQTRAQLIGATEIVSWTPGQAAPIGPSRRPIVPRGQTDGPTRSGPSVRMEPRWTSTTTSRTQSSGAAIHFDPGGRARTPACRRRMLGSSCNTQL